MAKLKFEDLGEDAQAKVLAEHPQFHTYGFEAKQAVLKKAKRRADVAKNVSKHVAKTKAESNKKQDEIAQAVISRAKSKPTIAEPIAPAEAAPVAPATPTAAPKPKREKSALFGSGDIRTLVVKAGSGRLPHMMAMTGLVGKMLNHMDEHGEGKQVGDIHHSIDNYQDAMAKWQQHHFAAEDPETRDPNTHRNLAKRFISIAAQHLSDAANKFHGRFKNFDKSEFGGQSIGDVATRVANDYVATHVGKVTGPDGVPVNVEDLPREKLSAGLISGKLKDESSDQRIKVAAGKLLDPKFRKKVLDAADKRQAKIDSADYGQQEKADAEIESAKAKQPKHLELVKQRRTAEEGDLLVRQQLGRRAIQRTIAAEAYFPKPVEDSLPGAPTTRASRKDVFSAGTSEGKM